MSKKGIFGKAKKKKATSAAKEDVLITIDDAEMSDKALRGAELKLKKDEIESELKGIEGEIKAELKERFAELYEKEGIFPGSIDVSFTGSEDGVASLKFIPMDRYLKIDEDGYDTIAENYGEELVEHNETYSFNSKVLEKHMDTISELIENCDAIPEEDKENLLVVKEEFKVAKGTIKKLKTPKLKKFSVSELLAAINPIYQLKGLQKED